MGIFLPPVVFVAGKKRAGKDFLADALVADAGFEKTHIAAPWLLEFFSARGYHFDTYDEVPTELKVRYREGIQREATLAREYNPEVLIDLMREYLLERTSTKPLVVSGVRFRNEAEFAIRQGYFVVKVAVSDEVRRQRFLAAGENLELFDDPFEREIDGLPAHLEVTGDMPASFYPQVVGQAYLSMLRIREAVETGR